MKETKIQLTGFEMLEKTVNQSGNSGRVYVPVEWVGKKVKIILLENEQQKDRIKELEEELDKTKKEYEKLKKEFEDTKKEFEEFKAKHSKTVSELRKALNIKENKKEKSKPLGAPNGHKAYFRNIPERIDRIKSLNPNKCPYCKTKLGKTQEIRRRHVTDIKLVSKAETTRYDIHRKYCPKCKKIVEQEAPNVLPHARFGLNLMLLVMYLRLGLRLPGKKVCEYLQTIYSLSMSEAEVVHILKKLIVVFGDYYSTLEKMVKIARIKHTDSTSWRVNGKNYFAWVFIASGVVLYKIRKRNNSRVPLSVFGTKQKGNVLVIDRHSALRALAEKAGFLLQLCWSHILSDSKELAKSFDSEGRYVHKKLKDIYSLANGLNHKGNQEHVEQLKAEIFQLTTRHYTHSTIRRFVNNLYFRDSENIFRFVTDENIDSTNNISERELRELVIIRNISKGSRSTRGASTTAMLLSIIQTIRLKKENILQGLQKIINQPSGY